MAADGGAAAAARERRREQLRQWEAAPAPPCPPRPPRARAVRFERAAEFLAACAGGELGEARAMLRGGPGGERPVPGLVNGTNADGISALHQACIDENLEVVQFLVENGANVNQADNEGWTPLHVAASCGYKEIAQYLLAHGAQVAAVNSDGEIPLDIAEDDGMEALLREEIAKRGVDVAAAKREEEELMLQDTRQWLNAGRIDDTRHPKTGASALHVAAAKGYIEVMRLLLQAGYDPNVRDKDGWTPLHAAAHWGVEEACRLLVEHLCDMDTLNNVGQRPCDLADEDTLGLLEELQKKQEDLRSKKEAHLKQAVIDTSAEQQPVYSAKHRRSSVCRMSSREKISVQDQSKERKTLGPIVPDEENSSASEGEEPEKPTETTKPLPQESSGLNGVTLPPVLAVPAGPKFSGGRPTTTEDSSAPAWRAGAAEDGQLRGAAGCPAGRRAPQGGQDQALGVQPQAGHRGEEQGAAAPGPGPADAHPAHLHPA
ncbi:unnamed protein product [Lepidochelys kempii]